MSYDNAMSPAEQMALDVLHGASTIADPSVGDRLNDLARALRSGEVVLRSLDDAREEAIPPNYPRSAGEASRDLVQAAHVLGGLRLAARLVRIAEAFRRGECLVAAEMRQLHATRIDDDRAIAEVWQDFSSGPHSRDHLRAALISVYGTALPPVEEAAESRLRVPSEDEVKADSSEEYAQDNDLIGTTDAMTWAERFVKRVVGNPSIATDVGTMLAWFSGAIMAGRDSTADDKSRDEDEPDDDHGTSSVGDDRERQEQAAIGNNRPLGERLEALLEVAVGDAEAISATHDETDSLDVERYANALQRYVEAQATLVDLGPDAPGGPDDPWDALRADLPELALSVWNGAGARGAAARDQDRAREAFLTTMRGYLDGPE